MTEISYQVDLDHLVLIGFAMVGLSVAFFIWWWRSPDASDQLKFESQADPSQADSNDSCLQLLALLQTEARLLDFASEDIDAYPDQQVGAAARSVHQGLQRVLNTYFKLSAVRSEAEGDAITLPEGYDNSANRVVGNLVGQPPFKGTLVHAGWQVSQVSLPQTTGDKDLRILAPAEIEL